MKFGWIPRAAELGKKKKSSILAVEGHREYSWDPLPVVFVAHRSEKLQIGLVITCAIENSNIEGIKLGGRGWIFLWLLLF